MPATRPASMPKAAGPARASPEIFSRMRWYWGMGNCPELRGGAIADFEAGETGYRNIFAQFGNLLLNELVDGDRVLFDEGLLVQANLLEIFADTAVHNLFGNLLRFAFINHASLL